MYKNLVLSGCNFKLFSLLGALKHLENNNELKNIENFLGSSSGSLVCFMLCLGYGIEEMKLKLQSFITEQGFMSLDLEEVMCLRETLGLNNGKVLRIMIENMLTLTK